MINKEKIVCDISKKIGCKKYEAKNFLDAFEVVMREYLISGETVKILNLFKAEVKEYKGHIGRNPQTSEPMEIPAHKKVKITVSKGLNKKVNES